MQRCTYSIFGLTLNLVCLIALPLQAQIVPDSTLGSNRSLVIPNQLIRGKPSELINNGVSRGTTLLHSFREFNVNPSRAVYFSVPKGTLNILSRVTGANPSSIFGTLGVLGNADLFLLNPNGIAFGPGASLDLNGSFLGSTATSLQMADGTQFSASNPESAPLLTVGVPIGLNFAGNPGPIQVQGLGHTLSYPNGAFSPIAGAGQSTSGLRVPAGNSISLIGGNLVFEGGVLSAPSGRINLGSVTSGQVRLNLEAQGWSLDSGGVQSFGDINLDQRSSADASGLGGGSIHLVGRDISLSNGSYVLNQNQGLQPSGEIVLQASDTLSLIGSTSVSLTETVNLEATARSIVLTEGLFTVPGNISILSPRLILDYGGQIVSSNFSSLKTESNINIDASDSILVRGFTRFNPPYSSAITSPNYSSGQGANILLSTGKLVVENGGFLNASNLGSGRGGDVNINVSDSIKVDGFVPGAAVVSALGATNYQSGTGGDVNVNTQSLTVSNGGSVNSYTFGSGSAGNLRIDASSTIVSGRAQDPSFSSPTPSLSSLEQLLGFPRTGSPSIITAAGVPIPSTLRALLQLPPSSVGDSGSVEITTGNLIVDDGAIIAVGNLPLSTAGDARIQARSITLNNRGGVVASTRQTTAGNIFINAEDLTLSNGGFLAADSEGSRGGDIDLRGLNLLLLQNGSSIRTDTTGAGEGGNITINSDLLAALENSRISANAEQSRGGQVTINTQGLFLSPDSTITATSELGSQFDGVVEINTPDVDLSRTASEPPAGPETPSVSTTCRGTSVASASNLVNAGAGGLPSSSLNTALGREGWHVPPRIPQTPQASRQISPLGDRSPTEPPEQFVQSTGWIRNSDGTVDFVAETSKGASPRSQSNQACSRTNNSDNAQ